MALRLSEADPAKGKTEFAAAISAGVITSAMLRISCTNLLRVTPTTTILVQQLFRE